ncbi:carbonic anhydrase [Panaeolus papilionaceus]|nr:carbonic anhydrase [Panaeolus papilionaceus]
MMVDCSDSRVSEQDIFSAKPGTMFTAGNIANRFDEDDANSNAILSFAVETLKVKHVIVMGHYGCGGVAASMLPFDASAVVNASRADLAVQGWIKPIRELYMGSERPEIVAHREKHKNKPLTDLPELHDPAFRALVEENVKANVFKISKSRVMVDHYAKLAKSNLTVTSTTASSSSNPYGNKPITDVYIHGWVYDVENGRVSDLGVSVGPPGKEVFGSPFPGVGQ